MGMYWWGSYSQISPWFGGRPLIRSLSHPPMSLACPGRLLRYPLPLPCSNQMGQIQPRVPMAPQEGTFLRPIAWWLGDSSKWAVLMASALEFLWKQQGGEIRRGCSPICQYSLIHHWTTFLQLPTSLAYCQPLLPLHLFVPCLTGRNTALYLMHTWLYWALCSPSLWLHIQIIISFSFYIHSSLLISFPPCLLRKDLHSFPQQVLVKWKMDELIWRICL